MFYNNSPCLVALLLKWKKSSFFLENAISEHHRQFAYVINPQTRSTFQKRKRETSSLMAVYRAEFQNMNKMWTNRRLLFGFGDHVFNFCRRQVLVDVGDLLRSSPKRSLPLTQARTTFFVAVKMSVGLEVFPFVPEFVIRLNLVRASNSAKV